MNSQTQMMLANVNVEVLESVLYNADKDVPKIKLTLEFDDEQKYKRFVSKIAPISDEEQDVISASDSDQSDGDVQESNELAIKHESSTIDKASFIDELKKLELSIILKQNYQQQIKKIEKETGVTILIVPEKIKYFGQSEQDIEEAKSQVYQIKTNILISSFQKYGKQIYQSEYCQKKLNSCGIKLGKVAEKFYYWYDQSKCDMKKVDDCLEQIFRLKVHLFFPLLENYQYLKRRFNSKYIDAIIDTNAKLYERFIQKQINDDQNYEHKVELNKPRTEVIIHLPVREQSEIIKHEIKRYFDNLIHFFVHYKIQEGEQIQKIKQIQQILDEKGNLWNRYKDLLVLSFNIKGTNKPNESIVTTVAENQEKMFAQSLRPIFNLNLNCYIECLEDKDETEEDIDDTKRPIDKKVTKDYKRHDGVMVISPIAKRPGLFVQIIEELVLKPKLFSYLNKSKIQAKTQQESKSITNGNIGNTTSRINDTTSMIQHQNTEIEDDQPSFMNQKEENQFEKPILGEIKQNLAFKKYNFHLQDQEGNRKYDVDADQIKQKKTKFSEQLSERLTNVTRRKYKPYDVVVPMKYKNQRPNKNDIVTVFIKNSDRHSLDKATISVYLMADSKALSTDGWLLNVSKEQIKQESYKYEIPAGSFEIIKYLKYLSG